MRGKEKYTRKAKRYRKTKRKEEHRGKKRIYTREAKRYTQEKLKLL